MVGGNEMSYLIVVKDKTSLAYSRNSAIECAMRTLCKITGHKFYSDDNIMMCKCPDKMGDMTNVSRFYARFPTVISSDRDMYNENEASDYYFNVIKGNKVNIGYGLVTDLCESIYVPYSVVKDADI